MTSADTAIPVVLCGAGREDRARCARAATAVGARIAEVPARTRRFRDFLSAGAGARAALVVAGREQGARVRRDLQFAALLGIRHAAVITQAAAPARERLQTALRAFAGALGLDHVECIASEEAVHFLRAALDAEGAAGDTAPAVAADQFEAALEWDDARDMFPGRPYLFDIGGRHVPGTLGPPKYRLDIGSSDHLAARTLARGEIGVCNVALETPVAFDPAARASGRLAILDGPTGRVLGAGILRFSLRRAHNLHWQAVEVNKEAHAALKGHHPCVVWFTGLSGAGKSSVANLVERKLHAMGLHTYLLDGDNVRHGLNRDLGFTQADRVENIRRIAEVARLMVDAGLVVLAAFISPFREERALARRRVAPGEFCEVFVDTPLEVAERRDAKGLYRKARAGELRNFTGIDSPYEPPENPELRIDGAIASPEAAADAVIDRLRSMGVLGPR